MSSIEERLARDIAAVTGGVVVTESDLRDAREAVDDRLDERRQHDRRRTLAIAGAAAVLIPILGFAAFESLGGEDKSAPPVSPVPTSPDANDDFLTGETPTPELLQGVWRVDNDTLLLRFTADGEVRFDNGGQLFATPAVLGTFEVEGDLITVNVDGGVAVCGPQTFAMRASLPEPGAMHFVHTQPGTGNCSSTQDERWVLEQVLPTNSKFLRGLKVHVKGDWNPPVGLSSLYGDWMAEGGGRVLELARNGVYFVADESGDAVDRGRWSFDGSASRITLVSGGSSPSCDQGDRVVLGGVEQTDPGTLNMRGTVEQDTCGGTRGAAAWILIPHEGG